MRADQSATHPRGERKQVTVMFIDVVDFSSIASTADAEDLQHWLSAFYTQVGDIVTAQEGEVTEYLGDGVVALFGLDRADELAATRAVNAALAAMERIDASPGNGIKMELRIGVATGEAAIRDPDAAGNLPRVTGMVTTLARRVQEAAEPGEVLIAAETQALLRDSVAAEPVGERTLKGFAEPQLLYRPVAGGTAGTTGQGHPPFVARKAALQRIAQSKVPSLIIGPAGIGKTALARHLAAQAESAVIIGADGLNARASYQPFARWIAQTCGRALPDYADLTTHFPDLDADATGALALVLGLPEGQRLLIEKSNLALSGFIEASLWAAINSRHPSGLLVVEDLHWLDAASFGVLVHIIQNADPQRLGILMTSREDTKIGRYLGRLPVTTVPLDPLTNDEAREMLAALSEDTGEIAEAATLLEQAAGIPLFLEQLYQRHLSGGAAADRVPGSLMDLLSAQIDATGEAKPILQRAAIIGRGFDRDLLAGLTTDTADLEQHLRRACAQGVLRRVGGGEYQFAHALLQQAAYQGMLRATRVDYHGQVAAYLQEHRPDLTTRTPALLADHLRRAGQHVPAIQTYLAASQQALFQGAFEDAEAHVQTAITLCAEAPEEVDTGALEIASHSALGSIRMQTLGFTAAPVQDAFEKVAALAATQNTFSLANGPAFYGSFTHGIVSGDKAAADKFSQLLRAAANAVPAAETGYELQVASANVDAALHFYTGRFSELFASSARLRDIYDVTRHGAMIASYGADTFAAGQMFEVAGRAIAGDADKIDALIAETDAHQALLNIPVMAPWAQIWGAVPLHYAGQQDTALARVGTGIETAVSQGALFWQVTGAAWLHVMDPSQSDSADGLAAFEQVIKAHEGMGANVGLPYFRAHFARALAKHEKADAAYQAGQQAMRENASNGLHCWYPEVLRLHAATCAETNREHEAAQHLSEAVAVSEMQGAGLWLIRARIDQFRAGLITPAALQDALKAAPQVPEVATAQKLLVAA